MCASETPSCQKWPPFSTPVLGKIPLKSVVLQLPRTFQINIFLSSSAEFIKAVERHGGLKSLGRYVR